jgi:hypothetical protein
MNHENENVLSEATEYHLSNYGRIMDVVKRKQKTFHTTNMNLEKPTRLYPVNDRFDSGFVIRRWHKKNVLLTSSDKAVNK